MRKNTRRVRMRDLREAIRESFQKKEVPTVPKSIIEKYDLDNLSLSGEGVFGAVYVGTSGRLNHREIAVKVCKEDVLYFEDVNDWESYQKMMTLREELPESVRKHVVKIFSVEQSVEGPWIIILEKLVPAPTQVINLLFKNSRESFKSKVSEPQYMVSTFRFCRPPKGYVDRRTSQAGKVDKIDQYLNLLEKEWLNVEPQEEMTPEERSEATTKSLDAPSFNDRDENVFDGPRGFRNTAERLAKKIFGDDWPQSFTDHLCRCLKKNLMSVPRIDSRMQSTNDSRTTDPTIQKFRDVAMALLGHKVTPEDVHYGNVMMRPKTGDLVISDVGLFGFDS